MLIAGPLGGSLGNRIGFRATLVLGTVLAGLVVRPARRRPRPRRGSSSSPASSSASASRSRSRRWPTSSSPRSTRARSASRPASTRSRARSAARSARRSSPRCWPPRRSPAPPFPTEARLHRGVRALGHRRAARARRRAGDPAPAHGARARRSPADASRPSLDRGVPPRRLVALRDPRPRLVEHVGVDQDRPRRPAAAVRRRDPLRARGRVLLLGGAAAARRDVTTTDWRLAALLGAAAVRDDLRPHLLGRAVRAVRPRRRPVRRAAALRRAARRASCCPRSRSARAWSPASAIAIAGLALAFRESLDLGDAELAGLAAAAVVVSPIASAIGNVAIKLRGGATDAVVLNGWAMLLARRAAARRVARRSRTGARRLVGRGRSARSPTSRSRAPRSRSSR